MSLSSPRTGPVPPEIISNIAFYLACDNPFRPPSSLCAFQSASRHLYSTLHSSRNPVLWAAAFRYRFDSAAVQRRNFRPTGSDYAEQLRQYTHTLAAIRSLNVLREDISDTLSSIYIMLLENNGKNRTQLEAAGLDVFIDIYARTRIWTQAHMHEGWPADTDSNSYALWIMWMMTTPKKLQSESSQHREQIVTLILPFVLNPYRYHQADAPPAHFHLPLPSTQDVNILPQSFPSAHGPYPVYVIPRRVFYLPYFGSFPPFSPPPITTAAKLLYFARREIIPFGIPNHIPRTRAEAPPAAQPSPTQEDIREANSQKGALPPRRVTWDWATGFKIVNGVPLDNDASDSDHSSNWDCDFWRRRMCGDVWGIQPKWRPGRVYVPGSMDGLWQGRLIFPAEQSMRHLAGHAIYPQQTFNEMALALTHQPMFMRLKEHHAVSTHPHVPFPPQPSPQPTNDDGDDGDDDFILETDLSMRNAWFPGFVGSVNFTALPVAPYNKVLIKIEDHAPSPTSSHSSQEGSGWIYETFDPRLDAERRKEAERDGRDYLHEGHRECEMCFEREELIRKGAVLDETDSENIRGDAREAKWWMSDQDWELETIFTSVGLGRDQTRSLSTMDEEEEYQSDMDFEQDGERGDEEGSEQEDEELNYISDPNADAVSSQAPPSRRGTDRAKIEPCDGIRDIVFNGSTDRRHALAWNDYVFYGRVRPWDGLIGILRRSYWPTQHFIFFYGYLVGDESFVGNWRVAATDPLSPTWESAFVMSKRKDEDGN